MSTRGRLGLELADGSILSVYHHYDSYPSWLGRILETHYNTKEKVVDLIDGGDISCAWSDTDWSGNEWSDCKYKALTYEQRGEDCPPRLDGSLKDYANKDAGEEYHYVYRKVGGEYTWVCIDMHSFEDKDPETVSIPSGALAC